MFGDIGRDQPPCLTLATLHGDAAHLEPTTDVVQIERLGHHHVAVTEDLHRLDEKHRRHAPPRPELRLRRFGLGLKHDYLMRQLRAYQDGRRAGGLSCMKHIMAPLFQTPRMMQAIGSYAEGVHLVPVVDAGVKDDE